MRLGDLDALMEITNQQGHLTVDDILNEPTIDAVPVVRCKDCIHGNRHIDGFVTCSHPAGRRILMGNFGFCSCGDRKEADGNG